VTRWLPLVLLAAATATPAQTPAARKVALLVGVGAFKHDLPPLDGSPQRDVAALEVELKKHGFEVVKLTDERATKAAVEARFRALLDGGGDAGKALGQGDVLLVALCSHGFTLKVTDPVSKAGRKEPFVAGHDAVPADAASMISLTGLIEAAKPFGATKLFLVDACRESAGDPNRGAARGIEGTQLPLPKRTAVLFACGQDQLSHQSDKAGGHGLFTFAVLKTLRAGGRLTWTRLVAGVEEQFETAELRAMIPKGRVQVPVEAKGELGTTELVAGGVANGNRPATPVPVTAAPLGPNEKWEEFEYYVNDEDTPRKANRRVLTLDIGGGEVMEFVRVEPGAFQMGAPAKEVSENDNRLPVRKVRITRPFYLGKYEVTQIQYVAVTGKNPTSTTKGHRLPVADISWDDAANFCRVASQVTRRKIELPTEAEWEYACRAGTTTRFSFGSQVKEKRGNFLTREIVAGQSYTYAFTEVGSFPANPWGLHDMHGNVREWCQDWYGPYAKVKDTDDPVQTVKQEQPWRAWRDGDPGSAASSSSRWGYPVDTRWHSNGLRVCLRPD
jgi:formylglycine-generating enzyme required for sulfatase activity